ncbi:hypothetical protein [Roseivivax isoporae]|nr:hypothetical protein [Roseivivax isoporae]
MNIGTEADKAKGFPAVSDHLKTLHEIMCGLVAARGQTSAAYAIQALTGSANPDHAGLSLKMSGQRQWALADLVALESSGNFAATGYLADRRAEAAPATGDIFDALSTASVEGGEAIGAAARFAHTLNEGDRAKTLKEAREARDAFDRLIDHLGAPASMPTPIKGRGAS